MFVIILLVLLVVFPALAGVNALAMYWAMVGLITWQGGGRAGWGACGALCFVADLVFWAAVAGIISAAILAITGAALANGAYARRLRKAEVRPGDVRDIFK